MRGRWAKKFLYQIINEYDSHEVLIKCNWPENLHEFDIILIDLAHFQIDNYKKEEHDRQFYTGKSASWLLCSFPETLLDPRPLAGSSLRRDLYEIKKNNYMMIIFSEKSYDVDYQLVTREKSSSHHGKTFQHNIYSFIDNPPLSKNKYGTEIQVCDIREDLKKLFDSHKNNTKYYQTFFHRTIMEEGKKIKDPSQKPLMKNLNGEIISICEYRDNSMVLFLPQISDKSNFLNEFLSKIAPDLLPEIFPYHTTFKWIENENYWIPNHKELLDKRKILKEDYEKYLKEIKNEINGNLQEYSFLHKILTGTGDDLVDALIKYFKWLGFKNVKKMDESKSEPVLLEEDIQIEMDRGLLIIECKGIGGTSTDSDCSQISKVKHRRCKERNKFDVFALYIVNHQRYLPPVERKNPPFTIHQIQDAKNDERGLLTTWRLFNLYFEIEDGIINKDEAIQDLLQYGLIEFESKDIKFIGRTKKSYKDGFVCILKLDNVRLKVGEELLVKKNRRLSKVTIEEIQVNDETVESAENCEVGIKLSGSIIKNSKIWKKVIE